MKNYNVLYLKGDRHVTDEMFKKIIFDNYGHDIPEEDLNTPRVNDYYVSLNEEKHAAQLKVLLANNGLLDGENNE